ncbi:MAG: ABC transporter permease [Nitrososphaerales archaeon]
MTAKTSYLTNIWNRRSLIRTFAINDLKIRYRNSILGFFWSVLEPLLMLSVLYIIFTNIIRTDIPYYALYLLLGLIMWNMLNRGTSMSLNSIIGRSGIITKIYFPREIPAISSCITAFIMMLFELGVFSMFLIAFQFLPPLTISVLPLLLIIEFILVLGLALPLSVLNVYFRDVQYIWAVIIHAGFFLMPIIYRVDVFPERLQTILSTIPMARILDMAHNVALYDVLPSVADWTYVVTTSLAILVIGYLIFRRFEARVGEEL